MNFLQTFGWNDFFEQQQTLEIRALTRARVIAHHRTQYVLATPHGQVEAELGGKLFYESRGTDNFPVVGDWVAADCQHIDSVNIRHIFNRKNKLSRTEAGTGGREQIIAANLDTIFVMSSLNHELNLRRLERYIAVVFESGAQPVVLLTKADLQSDHQTTVESLRINFPHVPVHAISSLSVDGLSGLEAYLQPGHTTACIGSSGVGKSTFINALLGDNRQATQGVREEDSKGRHTTTHRELFVLPTQALVIDTPGIRELQIWSAEEGIHETFGDIKKLGHLCQFNDCGHETEPGCAIKQAIEQGELELARYHSYQKLLREERYQARKGDRNLQREEKQHWKRISKEVRNISKHKRLHKLIDE